MIVPKVISPVFRPLVIAAVFATTFMTYSSMFGAPCQYVSFLLKIAWSPLRHSLNLNGPLETVGFVFSGALSKSSGFDVAVRYFPNTCVGMVYPIRSRIAGQDTFAIFTDHFFGFAASMVTPEIDVADAVGLHCVPVADTQ